MATADQLEDVDSCEPEESARSQPSAAPRRLEVRPHLRRALALLLQAHEYALELQQDAWDLAVELDVLREADLTNSDLRWLVAAGLVDHAVETTGPTDRARQFHRTALLNIRETTCVVLTSRGVAAARELCGSDYSSALGHGTSGTCTAAPASLPSTQASLGASLLPQDTAEESTPDQPVWDDQRRQLRVGEAIVKEFKLPSPNQETVLMAFEEEGWPPRIDDPLPPQAQLDPRRRLHDTIKALNRKQKRTLLRFMGDGSGEGIRWEFAAEKKQGDGKRDRVLAPTTCPE